MNSSSSRVAVIGGGPAGLMAADRLAAAGVRVDLFDAMPSVGRKFLLAGRGGLNLTHSEPFEDFQRRFGARRADLAPMLDEFGPREVRAWADGLGVQTFIGSSGRIFPLDLKAAPLLRAWLQRLRGAGVVFHQRHRWTGWDGDGRLALLGPEGPLRIQPDAVVLALGGASWSRLGSDGAWVGPLRERGVEVATLLPSNCGFDVALADHAGAIGQAGWTEHFRTRSAGQPVKNVAMSVAAGDPPEPRAGEFVITERGVEGSLIYALSGPARDAIASSGRVVVHIDLLPHRSADFVQAEVARPRGARSLTTHLKSRLGIDGVKAALLHELSSRAAAADPAALAAVIKRLPLVLCAPRPIEEAISSAGGVRFESLDPGLMLRACPGVFCAGEMLDWEAPTGGYLLTACLATGAAAAAGVIGYLGVAGRPEASYTSAGAAAPFAPRRPTPIADPPS